MDAQAITQVHPRFEIAYDNDNSVCQGGRQHAIDISASFWCLTKILDNHQLLLLKESVAKGGRIQTHGNAHNTAVHCN